MTSSQSGGERARVAGFAVVMIALACAVAAGLIGFLYRTAVEGQKARLVDLVATRAASVEAIVAGERGDSAHAARILEDSWRRIPLLGETGEFTLGRRVGDRIHWIVRPRHAAGLDEPTVLSDASTASPMRRALAGETGAGVEVDYRGVAVLAAYRPVEGADWGLVAKIDLAEIRAPFIGAASVVLPVIVVLVAGGVWTFLRLTNPMVRRIEESRAKLERLSRLRAFAAAAGHEILRERDPERLYRSACRLAVEIAGFRFAWVGLVDPAEDRLRPVARAGFEDGYLDAAVVRARSGKESLGPAGTAIRERRPSICDDVATDPRMEPWRDAALARGYRACAGFPLVREGSAIGALVVYAGDSGFFDAERTALLEDLAADISLALDSIGERSARARAEAEIAALNRDLERRVAERTHQLDEANRELQAFAYSVSHDLRAPLRAIDGFSQALEEDWGEKLDDEAKGYLARVRTGVGDMTDLIDGMLSLSRLSRGELEPFDVDLAKIAREIVEELRRAEPSREIEVVVAEPLRAVADPRLVRAVLQNLLDNAWKFTGKTPNARIEVGSRREGEREAFFVRDNGAGFEPSLVEKLFRPFQRLHAASEFPGNGIGLATVKRIVARHGGEVAAEGDVDRGATFSFTLPTPAETLP